MGEGIGYLGLGMVIGSAVAPGIGVTISENFGMRMTFLMSAVLTVAALVILCLFHEEKKEKGNLWEIRLYFYRTVFYHLPVVPVLAADQHLLLQHTFLL